MNLRRTVSLKPFPQHRDLLRLAIPLVFDFRLGIRRACDGPGNGGGIADRDRMGGDQGPRSAIRNGEEDPFLGPRIIVGVITQGIAGIQPESRIPISVARFQFALSATMPLKGFSLRELKNLPVTPLTSGDEAR